MLQKLRVGLARRIAGRKRLYARKTWGELNKSEREDKAVEVMDLFQERCKDEDLNCTWIPRRGVIVFYETDETPLPVDDIALRAGLVAKINQAFADNGAFALPS